MIQSTGASVRRKRALWRRIWPTRSQKRRCSMSLPIMSTWPNAPKTEGREASQKLRTSIKPNRSCDYVSLYQLLPNAPRSWPAYRVSRKRSPTSRCSSRRSGGLSVFTFPLRDRYHFRDGGGNAYPDYETQHAQSLPKRRDLRYQRAWPIKE
jgi:hypothetical protein